MNVTDIAWLSGLFDGEGCLFAYFYPADDGRLPLTLRAEIALRADDRPLLDRIALQTQLGKVRIRAGRGAGGNPQATWTVNGKDCAKLVDILDVYPLRSKKQRDYEIWKQIVALYVQFRRGGAGARSHNQPLIDQIQQLTAELKEVRAYADPQ